MQGFYSIRLLQLESRRVEPTNRPFSLHVQYDTCTHNCIRTSDDLPPGLWKNSCQNAAGTTGDKQDLIEWLSEGVDGQIRNSLKGHVVSQSRGLNVIAEPPLPLCNIVHQLVL